MKYFALNKQSFIDGDYQILPIRFEDRYSIMKWRNEQIYHLRQKTPLTEAEQDAYFEKVVAEIFKQERPNQILFSFLKKNKCIGYGGLVHINWIDKNAEISFLMQTELEKDQFAKLWTTFLKLVEEVAFEQLYLHKVFTYAIDLRPKLYPILCQTGFEKEAVLKQHVYFNGVYSDVIIHGKINPNE